MLRSVSLVIIFLVALGLTAQWSSDQLTITASPLFGHTHPVFMGQRGGTPYNDLCQNAVVTPVPANGSASVTGTNIGATDTENFGNPNVWEAFSIDTCSTITVSYCGTDPVHTLVYSILLIGCPDPIANVQNNGTETCADGNTIITFESLPAGTYYVPVLLYLGESEGPYTITFSSSVCMLPPPNETCGTAIMVPVANDCSQGGAIVGNNINAVQNGADPSCSTSATQVQDVWYAFDSGTNTEVSISLASGTAGDLGVEVLDACGGNVVLCATVADDYVVPVIPQTVYKVRVFSNNDFGLGGSFSLCVGVPAGAVTCDGGQVALLGGGDQVTVCAQQNEMIELAQTTSGTAALALVLTTANDTVLGLLPNTTLDTDTLPVGTYHVWGLSYDGDLINASPGVLIDSVLSSGICIGSSAGFVEVVVDLCQGIHDAQGRGTELRLVASEGGASMIWNGPMTTLSYALFDGRGVLIVSGEWILHPGDSRQVRSGVALAAGMYLLRVENEARAEGHRFFVR